MITGRGFTESKLFQLTSQSSHQYLCCKTRKTVIEVKKVLNGKELEAKYEFELKENDSSWKQLRILQMVHLVSQKLNTLRQELILSHYVRKAGNEPGVTYDKTSHKSNCRGCGQWSRSASEGLLQVKPALVTD